MSAAAETGITRRRFVRDAGAAGAGLALAGPLADAGLSRAATLLSGPSVAVLGGGVGGLTAAHELAERGFAVTVYERKELGGKARSMPVPGTGSDGRLPLPGEHGFRFFPGFYHHIPDTMRRIPFPGNLANEGVRQNLVPALGVSFARDGGREDLTLSFDPRRLLDLDALRRLLVAAFQELATLPAAELLFFVRQLLIYFTSSDQRRFGEWEYESWWDYTRAAEMSEEYQKFLAIGLTRNLVAAKAELASTRTIGNMAEAFIMNMMGRGADGAPDRVLDGPTNEVWIDPWVEHLETLGVSFRSATVESLTMSGGRISSATVRLPGGATEQVNADWFISAMPVERARQLWSPQVLAADPKLAGLDDLLTEWMNGIQFYLREPVPILRGHLSYVDSPWALTSISQAQFWRERDIPATYGDGTVKDCLSVDISNWEEPGILYGKTASSCTPEEIAEEVWAQIKSHLEDTGLSYLPDGVRHSWFLDPAISYPGGGTQAQSDEPLMVNTIGSWDKRPEAATAIPNLFLASDYVRVNIDLATMEGANEAARRSVNALLDRAGSRAGRARIWTLYKPPEFALLKLVDALRYRLGQPHLLDLPYPQWEEQARRLS